MRKAVIIAFIILTAGLSASAQALKIGSRCLAYWEENKTWYVGAIVEEDSTIKGGGYLVVFADGDVAVVPATLVKPLTIGAGSKVMAMWWKNGSFYPGTVARVVGEALYINFDDGDKGWTSWAGIAVP